MKDVRIDRGAMLLQTTTWWCLAKTENKEELYSLKSDTLKVLYRKTLELTSGNVQKICGL